MKRSSGGPKAIPPFTERQDNILISLIASSENAFAREALTALQRVGEVYDVTEDDRHNVINFNPDF